ncbi:MAG: HEPN domain-containing protein [Acidobacteriota bacterium]|nr:HEPN domain-containing protein [Acidobacteriota bacterium]
MKPITQEWIGKAEGDWATLMRKFRARNNLNYDAVCFHAQQCAKNISKPACKRQASPFKKIYDLKILLNDILPIEPTWINLQNSADSLTIYAVKFRYPGSSSNKLEAKEAVKHCHLIRNTVRQSFNLPIK